MREGSLSWLEDSLHLRHHGTQAAAAQLPSEHLGRVRERVDRGEPEGGCVGRQDQAKESAD